MQSPPLPSQFDPDRLQRLIDIIGPDQTPAFLAQLDLDLSEHGTRIALAARERDWETLRDACHVLTSLAGSAGALGLQDMAQRLNAAAHAARSDGLPELTQAMAIDLAALRARLAAIASGKDGAR